MIVLVSGPTTWPCTVEGMEAVHRPLAELPPGSMVVHGDAAGVDHYADCFARHAPLFLVKVPYYGAGGAAGGPMRNALMAKIVAAMCETWPDQEAVVYAFGSPGQDRGTDDLVRQADRHGLDVRWFAGPPQ